MSKEKLLQLSIPLFYTLIIIKHYSAILSELSTILYMALGYITLFSLLTSKKIAIDIKKWTLFILFLGIINALFSSLYCTNYRYQDFLLLFCYMGIALVPFRVKLNYTIFLWFYILLIVFFSIHIIRDVDPNDIFTNISRNSISVFLLIAASFHIISSHQNKKKTSLTLVLLSLFITTWTTSRSGIIVFTILTVLLVLSDPELRKYRFFYIITLFTLSFLLYKYQSDSIILMLERFSNYGIVDRPRSSVNKEYLIAINDSPLYLFFGVPLRKISSIVELDLNPHNSIIRLHVYYGFAGIIVISILTLKTAFYFIKNSNFMYLFLLLCVFLRSVVDSTAFHGSLDPIIYILLFQSFYKQSFRKKCSLSHLKYPK